MDKLLCSSALWKALLAGFLHPAAAAGLWSAGEPRVGCTDPLEGVVWLIPLSCAWKGALSLPLWQWETPVLARAVPGMLWADALPENLPTIYSTDKDLGQCDQI